MQTPTEREKRTIRIGGIILAVYLVVFFGAKGAQGLGSIRADYEKREKEAHPKADLLTNR